MKDFVKRMIEEHKELVCRTSDLHNYVYGIESANDSREEFANKCIQLAAMKKYEEALRARLYNQGIHITEDFQYFEKIDTTSPVEGSDKDIDKDE